MVQMQLNQLDCCGASMKGLKYFLLFLLSEVLSTPGKKITWYFCLRLSCADGDDIHRQIDIFLTLL